MANRQRMHRTHPIQCLPFWDRVNSDGVPAILGISKAHFLVVFFCRPRCGALLVADARGKKTNNSIFVSAYECDSCACSFFSLLSQDLRCIQTQFEFCTKITRCIVNIRTRWFAECEYSFRYFVWCRNSFLPFKANTVSIPTTFFCCWCFTASKCSGRIEWLLWTLLTLTNLKRKK